jgi:hypothetical protein
MKPVGIGILVGILCGIVATVLQVFWTPANMVFFGTIPLAILAGVITGWAVPSKNAHVGRIVAGSIAGSGVLIGMVIGGIIYLNLPATHIPLLIGANRPPGTGGDFIAEDLILRPPGFVGAVGLGLAILANLLTGSFVQKRLH